MQENSVPLPPISVIKKYIKNLIFERFIFKCFLGESPKLKFKYKFLAKRIEASRRHFECFTDFNDIAVIGKSKKITKKHTFLWWYSHINNKKLDIHTYLW